MVHMPTDHEIETARLMQVVTDMIAKPNFGRFPINQKLDNAFADLIHHDGKSEQTGNFIVGVLDEMVGRKDTEILRALITDIRTVAKAGDCKELAARLKVMLKTDALATAEKKSFPSVAELVFA